MKAETAYEVFQALSEDERKRFASMSGLSLQVVDEDEEEVKVSIGLTQRESDIYVRNHLFHGKKSRNNKRTSLRKV